jgi:hypothetical protein
MISPEKNIDFRVPQLLYTRKELYHWKMPPIAKRMAEINFVGEPASSNAVAYSCRSGEHRENCACLGAPRPLQILLPQDERALAGGLKEEHDPEWLVELERLFREEGRIAFDLFAPKTAATGGTRPALIRSPASNQPEAQEHVPDRLIADSPTWAQARRLRIVHTGAESS